MSYTYGITIPTQLMCGTTYMASTNFKSTHNLSISNVTLQSIAIWIVATVGNIATTMRMDSYLLGVCTHN